MPRIFISHAVADKDLIEAFVTLLQTGLDISRKEIFCSSIEGMKIRPGKSFVEFIRAELSAADYVIMIVTPAYYESAFCMCELGGAWLQVKDAFPILVKPITYDNLKAVLHGVQCGKIEDPQDLNQLNDCLSELGFGKPSAARWEVRRDTFLSDLPRILSTLKQQTLVPVADLTKANAKYDEAQKLLKEQGEEIARLERRIAELEKLKDQKGVKELRKKHRKEDEEFAALVDEVKKALERLPSQAVEVVFHEFFGNDYTLGDHYRHQNEWEDAEDAEKEGYVTIDENVIRRNEDNPEMADACDCVENLRAFMSSASEEFAKEFATENKVQFDIGSRQFWRVALGT